MRPPPAATVPALAVSRWGRWLPFSHTARLLGATRAIALVGSAGLATGYILRRIRDFTRRPPMCAAVTRRVYKICEAGIVLPPASGRINLWYCLSERLSALLSTRAHVRPKRAPRRRKEVFIRQPAGYESCFCKPLIQRELEEPCIPIDSALISESKRALALFSGVS